MKFRPLHDRVVVKRIDAEERSAGRDRCGPKSDSGSAAISDEVHKKRA